MKCRPGLNLGLVTPCRQPCARGSKCSTVLFQRDTQFSDYAGGTSFCPPGESPKSTSEVTYRSPPLLTFPVLVLQSFNRLPRLPFRQLPWGVSRCMLRDLPQSRTAALRIWTGPSEFPHRPPLAPAHSVDRFHDRWVSQPQGRSVRAIGGEYAARRREQLLDASTAGDRGACVVKCAQPRNGHCTVVPHIPHKSLTRCAAGGGGVSSSDKITLHLWHPLPFGPPRSLMPLGPRALGVVGRLASVVYHG